MPKTTRVWCALHRPAIVASYACTKYYPRTPPPSCRDSTTRQTPLTPQAKRHSFIHTPCSQNLKRANNYSRALEPNKDCGATAGASDSVRNAENPHRLAAPCRWTGCNGLPVLRTSWHLRWPSDVRARGFVRLLMTTDCGARRVLALHQSPRGATRRRVEIVM